jgi:hypothetical protein
MHIQRAYPVLALLALAVSHSSADVLLGACSFVAILHHAFHWLESLLSMKVRFDGFEGLPMRKGFDRVHSPEFTCFGHQWFCVSILVVPTIHQMARLPSIFVRCPIKA